MRIQPEHLWYFVGLITSDGCLSTDGSHINITSKDHSLLKDLRTALGIANRIGTKIGGSGSVSFQIQMGDKSLYRFLLDVGLTPHKSLTLGSLNIPISRFPDFLRGMIDGDGCIHTWIHSSNGRRQWALKISSASPVFASWLRLSIEAYFGVRGRIHIGTGKGKRHPIHLIKFGKLAAQVILGTCYYPGCLAMPRKLQRALQCVTAPNGVRKYGDVVRRGGETEDTADLKSAGREAPVGVQIPPPAPPTSWPGLRSLSTSSVNVSE